MKNIQQLPLYLQHSLDHINFSSLEKNETAKANFDLSKLACLKSY